MSLLLETHTDDRLRSIAWLQEHLDCTGEDLERLERFVALVLEENGKQNLIAKRTEPDIWSRHVIDSAQLLRFVPRGTNDRWLDMGTGAGFPGVICATLSRQKTFLLVEQRRLRADFLWRAIDVLGLSNATVAASAVSEVPRETMSVISARAFAPLPNLLESGAPFASRETLWLLPKGKSAASELAELQGWEHCFRLEQSVTDPGSNLIVGSLIGRTCKDRRM